MTKEEVLSYYDSHCESYGQFMDLLEKKIKDELKATNIDGAIITSRIKRRDKFVKKVERKGYTNLDEEFTDFCGIRIILNDLLGVDAVTRYIEDNYKIDWDNSEDKKKLLSTDKVGYLSVHYIVSFSDNDAKLLRYQKYSGLKAEIQVRTILQHAWSEMTHDTIYHTKGNIGADKRRTVNLIAGLLELADTNIRDLNIRINEEVSSAKDGDTLNLTDAVLIDFMRSNFYDSYMIDIEKTIQSLNLCSIKTVADLKEICKKEVVNYINKNNYSFLIYDTILKDLLIINDVETYMEKIGETSFSDFELNLFRYFKVSVDKYKQ